MADQLGRQSALAEALEAIEADVVHVGIFDYAGMFRERRLRRADLVKRADTAVFANVLPKWDLGENILLPGPYGSETVAYDVSSVRPYPFEKNAAALVADYTGPQAEIMPRRVLAQQVTKARDLGFDVNVAFEFEFIVLNETAETLRAKSFANLNPYAPDNRCLVETDGGGAGGLRQRSRGSPEPWRCRSPFAQRRTGTRLLRGDAPAPRCDAGGR
jgi:glutamine synthetase